MKSPLKVLAYSAAVILSAATLSACNRTSDSSDSSAPVAADRSIEAASSASMDEDTASGSTTGSGDKSATATGTSGSAHTPDMTPAPTGTPGGTPVPKMDSKGKKIHGK